MEKNIIIARGGFIEENYADEMFRLRHFVFKEKLNWKVNSIDNKEIDEFDDIKEVRYVLVTDKNKKVLGCVRLLPTTGKNMLANIFPYLMKNNKVPNHRNIWEISRFAVNTDHENKCKMMHFGEVTALLAKGMTEFSKEMGITSFVGVTTPHVEKLIRRLGVNCNRLAGIEMVEQTPVVVVEMITNQNTYDEIDKRIIVE